MTILAEPTRAHMAAMRMTSWWWDAGDWAAVALLVAAAVLSYLPLREPMKYGALLGCKAQVIRAGADAPPVSKCQDAGGALFQFLP